MEEIHPKLIFGLSPERAKEMTVYDLFYRRLPAGTDAVTIRCVHQELSDHTKGDITHVWVERVG